MAVHTIAANFLYLLEEKGVAKDVIEKLQSVGITTMSRLALWVDTREELRGVMKELGFDPTADLENKLKTVTVMDAWESSKRRNEEEDRIHAEASSSNVPKNMAKQEHLQLRNAVESKYQTLHDRLCPSSGLMGRVLGMIEENLLELVALDEVISLEDGEDHRPGATVDAHGTIRITSSRRNIAEPTTSEGLRRRIRTSNWAFVMAKMRHPNRAWLQSATPHVAQDYADFFFGEDCLNLGAIDDEGVCFARPSFKQVLLYDKQIRKAQAAYINGGLDYLAALRKAWSDDEIRARHLITPFSVATAIAMAPRRRSRSPRADHNREWYKGQKVKGKAKMVSRAKAKTKMANAEIVPEARG